MVPQSAPFNRAPPYRSGSEPAWAPSPREPRSLADHRAAPTLVSIIAATAAKARRRTELAGYSPYDLEIAGADFSVPTSQEESGYATNQ